MSRSYGEMLTEFQRLVDKQGSKKAAAELLGVSESYLGDVYHGRRMLTKRIADQMGYEKTVCFVEKVVLR